MKSEALLNGYISEVSAAVICRGKRKKELLGQLRLDARAYLAENENATRQELEAVFGSPESVAASILANSESSEIRSRLSLKKTVIAFVLAVLFIYLAFVVISLIDVHSEAHGYIEEGLMCVYGFCVKGGAV